MEIKKKEACDDLLLQAQRAEKKAARAAKNAAKTEQGGSGKSKSGKMQAKLFANKAAKAAHLVAEMEEGQIRPQHRRPMLLPDPRLEGPRFDPNWKPPPAIPGWPFDKESRPDVIKKDKQGGKTVPSAIAQCNAPLLFAAP